MLPPRSSRPDDDPDEQRLLDELERLQLAIRETRATGARAQTDFDAQLRAFDAPARPAAARPEPAAPLLPPDPIRSADLPAAPAPQPLHDAADHDAAPHAGPALRATRWGMRLPVAAATLIAIVGLTGWLVYRTPAPPQPVAAPPPPAVVEPPPPVKPVAPVDPHALRIDLTTVRRVWLRVAVDGRIALEREVAAGEQLPFGADRAIVVRAGDAGAVTVRVGGVDQGAIGPDGKVLTREFAAPER